MSDLAELAVRFRTAGYNWEGRPWTLVPSLVVLGEQISVVHPDGKPGDGTVASKAHDQVSPNSDHRPRPTTGAGVVRAIDVGEDDDKDPMVDALYRSRDPRIAYIIYESRVVFSYPRNGYPAWVWQPYTGPAPHSHHFHLSTLRTTTADNDTRLWAIGDGMPHKHTPMPDELPRGWADQTWDDWVKASGTDPKSRTWTFYREDLSWVYTRVIRPMEARIASLEARVRALEKTGGGFGDGLNAEQVKAIINGSSIVAPD